MMIAWLVGTVLFGGLAGFSVRQEKTIDSRWAELAFWAFYLVLGLTWPAWPIVWWRFR